VITEEEVDDTVVAEADDDNAWEATISVKPTSRDQDRVDE